MKIRTFVCIELPTAERERIGALEERLRGHGARASWVAPSSIHLTLAFLGDVEADRIPSVTDAVTRASAGATSFELAVDGAGAFPALARPRVLWLGVGGDLSRLSALQATVARELKSAGFPRDEKPFRAHLTLARMKDDRSPEARATASALDSAAPSGPAFRVDEIVVMRSDLDPGGARHTPLARVSLGGARV